MRTMHLGIDLGTSSVKALLLDAHGDVVTTTQRAYDIARPVATWAEQSPDDWWRATCDAVRAAIAQAGDARIDSVGIGGQMHGCALVDADGDAVRPAIIWPDARSTAQADEWIDALGADAAALRCGMPVATGMAGVSLRWLAQHEPEAIVAARWVLQPKDVIRMRLTGEAGLDPSDACATLLLDLATERPDAELLALAGIDASQLPPIAATLGVAGTLTQRAADATGIPAGTPVAAGGSDQAMTALALGLDGTGRSIITISSGGTALLPTDALRGGSAHHHVLAGAHEHSRLAMSVVLAAGLATRWLATDVLGRDELALLADAAAIAPGADGLVASPHVGGLRTPTVDPRPLGAFDGLGYHHTPAHLMRAFVDGIALSLTGSLHAMAGDAPIDEIVLAGGGARHPIWQHAIADAAGIPVVRSSDEEHAALGAALAGAIAADADLAFDVAARIHGRIDPDDDSSQRYRALAAASTHAGRTTA